MSGGREPRVVVGLSRSGSLPGECVFMTRRRRPPGCCVLRLGGETAGAASHLGWVEQADKPTIGRSACGFAWRFGKGLRSRKPCGPRVAATFRRSSPNTAELLEDSATSAEHSRVNLAQPPRRVLVRREALPTGTQSRLLLARLLLVHSLCRLSQALRQCP